GERLIGHLRKAPALGARLFETFPLVDLEAPAGAMPSEGPENAGLAVVQDDARLGAGIAVDGDLEDREQLGRRDLDPRVAERLADDRPVAVGAEDELRADDERLRHRHASARRSLHLLYAVHGGGG